MRAVGGGAKGCADDNEQRSRDERRLPPNTVAKQADRDLAQDRA